MESRERTNKRQCIIVLGMHRSGTSLTAGILNILGVDFGKALLPASDRNPRGYFEDANLVSLNRQILKTLNSRWDDMQPLPADWEKSPTIAPFRSALKEYLNEQCSNEKLYGIKDPRICILLPLYLEVLHEIGVEPHFVVVLRKDIEVILSLQSRDNLSIKQSLELFEKYLGNIVSYAKREKCVFVDFDDLLKKTKHTIETMRTALGLSVKTYSEKQEELEIFIDPTLKHHTLDYSSFLKEMDELLQARNHRLQQQEHQIAAIENKRAQQKKQIPILEKQIQILENTLANMRGNIIVRRARRIENRLLAFLRKHPFGYQKIRIIVHSIRRISQQRKHRTPKNIQEMKIAVFVHLFYEELWEELSMCLKNISIPYDLFVSVVEGCHSEHLIQRMKTESPEVQIIVCPNKGYDIGGLVETLKRIDLKQYDLVCKIHTKKDGHYNKKYMNWRRQLLSSILGSEKRVEDILTLFIKRKNVGMVGCQEFHFQAEKYIGTNHRSYRLLCEELKIPEKYRKMNFFAGTMFWCRASILMEVQKLKLSASDFEEPTKEDGQKAHAVERVFGAMCRALGYSLHDAPACPTLDIGIKRHKKILSNTSPDKSRHDLCRVPERKEKIAIVGMSRSGTTALYCAIKESLPPDTRLLFEKRAYEPSPQDNQTGVLAKMLLAGNATHMSRAMNSFESFEKKILIVRDPRDILVSRILHCVLGQHWLQQPFPYQKYIALIEQKEKDPASVSLIDFFLLKLLFILEGREMDLPEKNSYTYRNLLNHISTAIIENNHFDEIGSFCGTLSFMEQLSDAEGWFTVKYEDIVDNKLENLEKYLGFQIKNGNVEEKHRHVERTKSYGNWKDWFTPEDVEFFKPVLESFMETYGYGDDWTLNTHQHIDHKHASGYLYAHINSIPTHNIINTYLRIGRGDEFRNEFIDAQHAQCSTVSSFVSHFASRQQNGYLADAGQPSYLVVVPKEDRVNGAKSLRQYWDLFQSLLPQYEPVFVSENEITDEYVENRLDNLQFAFCFSRIVAQKIAQKLPVRLLGDIANFDDRKRRLMFEDMNYFSSLSHEETGDIKNIPAVKIYVDECTDFLKEHTDIQIIDDESMKNLRESAPAIIASTNPFFLYYMSHFLGSKVEKYVLVLRKNTWMTFDTHQIQNLDPSSMILFKGQDLNPYYILGEILYHNVPEKENPVIKPLISIVVPIYDRDREIRRLANTIARQAYLGLEVIFVTNGSPPETVDAVNEARLTLLKRRMKCRVIRLENALGSATIPRDIGAFAANGELLCFIDSDDYLDDNFFRFFESGPIDTNTIYYSLKRFIDGGRKMDPGFSFNQVVGKLHPEKERSILSTLLKTGNVFNNSGTIISREMFLKTNGIDHRLTYGEDYYLWLRCAAYKDKAQCHNGIVNISLHSGNNELVVGNDAALENVRTHYQDTLI